MTTIIVLAGTAASGADRAECFIVDVEAARVGVADEIPLQERRIRVVTGRSDEFEFSKPLAGIGIDFGFRIDRSKPHREVECRFDLPNARSARMTLRGFDRASLTVGEGDDAIRFAVTTLSVAIHHWNSLAYTAACRKFKLSPADAIERMLDYEDAHRPPAGRFVKDVINHYVIVGDQYLFSRSEVSKQWKGIALRGYCIDANTGELTVVKEGPWLTDKQQKALWSTVERSDYEPYREAAAKRKRESQ